MSAGLLWTLVFPQAGGVNDGMIKDNYLGMTVTLKFPRTDDLAIRIYELGQDAMMFKVDLRRYFRQLPLDPGDYSLTGYIVDGKLYFDKALTMGMRTAPYIAQRMTDSIRYIHQQMGYFLLNYVDDFLGAETKYRIWRAYHHLTDLLNELQVETSPAKLVPPTTRIEFLGVTFDSQSMTMEVSQDRLQDMTKELDTWLYRTSTKRVELESLIGKIQFASKCVRAGRVFVSRLLNWLKQMDRHSRYSIPLEARKDIAWWRRFMQTYNGVSIVWLHNNPEPDNLIASDACLEGFGAVCGKQYIRGKFPQQWRSANIAHLEMRAVLAALNVWKDTLQGQYFWIHVDNEAVAHVINSGAARDEFLQDALREIAFIAAEHQFMIKAKHIRGLDNRIPDWLSRWGECGARRKFHEFIRDKGYKHIRVSESQLKFRHNW